MIKKKYLLAFGSLVTIVAPIAAVISCGSDNDKKVEKKKIEENKIIKDINLQSEVDKLQDFTTLDTAAIHALNLSHVKDDVTVKFKAITEVKANKFGTGKPFSEALTKNVKIERITIKKEYNKTTHKIIFAITLSYKTTKIARYYAIAITVTFAK